MPGLLLLPTLGWPALSEPLLPPLPPVVPDKPKDPVRKNPSRPNLGTCDPACVFFVATVSYTARCPAGMVGAPVTRTEQRSSRISEEHAHTLARLAAIEAAEAALCCAWCETRCAQPDCEIEIGTSGANLASNQIAWTPSAENIPVEGDYITVGAETGVVELSDSGSITLKEAFTSTPDEAVILKRRPFSAERCSKLSAEDAGVKAQLAANALAESFCEYGEEPAGLEPIGCWNL